MTKKKPYILRVASHTLRLPDYVSFFETRDRQTSEELLALQREVIELKTTVAALNANVTKLVNIDDRIVDLSHQVSTLSRNITENPGSPSSKKVVNATVADDHTYDMFYKKFEDKFRGSEDEIRQRIAEHLPLFKALPKDIQKKPIVDIGCGRGEMLRVMKDAGFNAIGVDMNETMVERAKEAGYHAVNDDAYSYLATLKTGSLAAITGFHIVEHIPFESLMKIFSECYRTVGVGGFVLFETPNPESLSVGAHTFYLDPSHQRPVPPQLLSFMLEYVGFSSEIVRLHKSKEAPRNSSKLSVELFDAINGNPDYAVVARKRS